ncbi:MAG UNVERIFIED_CONTAM: hypothetical protein LVT10_13095 [Anaerolineae bacterium]
MPGASGGNWTWRIGEDVLRGNAHHLLSRLTALYSRGRSSAVERVIYETMGTIRIGMVRPK